LQGMAEEVTSVKVKVIICFLLLWVAAGSTAMAGSDAVSVPENRIPWSGYWWPKSRGELVLGYTDQPSPLEKYDAYVTGYYPADATDKGLSREYDPEAKAWYGHCDDWAAASVLEPEPDHPGDFKGIPFNVGDKKGLITLFYDSNFTTVTYGAPNNGGLGDWNDIYPGGVHGFHQTLINYIAYQGLPIIMDVDPGPEVWSYPVYRYEMDWYDQGNTRHVNCKVWMASDFVTPDFVGTKQVYRTYTYALEIDDNGELLDEPGEWEGDSIDSHPDFMWFPMSSGISSFLNREVVDEIVGTDVNGSDDRFEPNNDMETAGVIEESIKNQFFWGNAQDEDWYRVPLRKGDYFYAFLLSPSDDLDVKIFDADGNEVGTAFYHGSKIDTVDQNDYYYVRVLPEIINDAYYSIEFFTSPSDVIPHVACLGGWDTTLTLFGEEWYFDQVRLNLFEKNTDIIDHVTLTVPEEKSVHFSFRQMFSSTAGSAKTAKLINLDANSPPYGFYSYSNEHQLANLPFRMAAAPRLFVPNIRNTQSWWTGVALMNMDVIHDAPVKMTAYSADGNVQAESNFIIGSSQNRVDIIEKFGAVPDETAWLEFESDKKMQGLVLWGINAGGANSGLAGIPLLREQHLSKVLFLPHLAVYGGWRTEVVIINPNPESATVNIMGYNSEGVSPDMNAIVLGSNRSWSGSVQELFNEKWDPQFVWAKIQSNRNLCGYQLFGRDLDGLAALPLQSEGEGKIDLRVKNFPAMESAWMGLVFLNTTERKVNLRAIPCDDAGNNLLGDEYLRYNVPDGLQAYHNVVGFIEQIFPGFPPQTVSLKIFTEEPILGFGIYEQIPEGKVDVLYLD